MLYEGSYEASLRQKVRIIEPGRKHAIFAIKQQQKQLINTKLIAKKREQTKSHANAHPL